MAEKLFELIVVEPQLKDQASKCRADLRNTFEKKRNIFSEIIKTYQPDKENAEPVQENVHAITSTVREELQWMAGIWTQQMDVSYRVAQGNAFAKADVFLDDGTCIMKNVPATALLELEKRAAEIHELLNSIPTLDPTKGFAPDPDKGRYYYKAREIRKPRTEKVPEVIHKFQPTEHHPGQADIVTLDKKVGTIVEQEWSTLLTPADKGKLIERAEELRRAFKTALVRANDTPVITNGGCGKIVFNYILEGVKTPVTG